MQQEVIVYITGICPQATRESVYRYCAQFTGEIINVNVFPTNDGYNNLANVTLHSIVGASNLINAINYRIVDGKPIYANICGYDVIRIQNEELYSIFISHGYFSSERDLFEQCLEFGQVFRVKLLNGCAIVQFYNEESMIRALNARTIRGGNVSKKTQRKVSKPQVVVKDNVSVQSKVSYKSQKSNKSNLGVSYVPREKVGVFKFEITHQSSSSAM
ncbi:hypothetical protein TVAG_302220 [Trichomonas vaginalis G3]|uniref:RRM domain-containing protein n=1 Tax=Trichomonas vaginalis (strain ATCC PRA-98 / G3) TaxID=412133 RepID=A2EGP7_TRIV3|nr:RNA-binding domain, RBD family-containing protein [Trichomonas vaginalis G3]EAY08135.1 hypothetical protein TVAG_302220 [Trichomonas vaginalis G3]KAI5548734.1 RNA-binding domain, RBD family-containing protein [Trichomonas vaginalis G3]|eukprot:XP_001320358.1 hypothetical protein [Trichomonas vaginalis G3]